MIRIRCGVHQAAQLIQTFAVLTLFGRLLLDFNARDLAQFADVQTKFNAVVDNAAKNAPAGSESAVAVMKSAVAAANNAFESVQKAVKQASEVAEANFNAVANQAVNAAGTAASAATGKKR